MPTKDDLRLTIEHVKYEWSMLRRTADILSRFDRAMLDDKVTKGTYSAILESFVVHVRNLVEFLKADRDGNPDYEYARARHYFVNEADWVIAEPRKLWAAETEKAYAQACQQVTHLTYHRAKVVDPAGWSWHVSRICGWLEPLLCDFRAQLLAKGKVKVDPQPDCPSPFAPTLAPASVIPLPAGSLLPRTVPTATTIVSSTAGSSSLLGTARTCPPELGEET